MSTSPWRRVTLAEAVRRDASPSPSLSGVIAIVPSSLAQTHTEMKQLEGVAKAKPNHTSLIGASIRETKFSDMSRDYLYCCFRFRKKQCHSVAPTKPIQVEDRQGMWTTYKGLNDWFNRSKRIMIELGFV